jgi:hypothetical protein
MQFVVGGVVREDDEAVFLAHGGALTRVGGL